MRKGVYNLKELKAELEDQKYDLAQGIDVIDFDDVMTAVGNLEKQLRRTIRLYERVGYSKLSLQQGARLRLVKEILGE